MYSMHVTLNYPDNTEEEYTVAVGVKGLINQIEWIAAGLALEEGEEGKTSSVVISLTLGGKI